MFRILFDFLCSLFMKFRFFYSDFPMVKTCCNEAFRPGAEEDDADETNLQNVHVALYFIT